MSLLPYTPGRFVTKAGLGIFRVSGQDIDSSRLLVDILDFGAFSLGGIDIGSILTVGTTKSIISTMETGSFNNNGQDISDQVTYNVANLHVDADIFSVEFYNGLESITIGPGLEDGQIQGGNVTARADSIYGSSEVHRDVIIKFYKNGILQDSTVFTTGSFYYSVLVDFLGVVMGDTLTVTIEYPDELTPV